MKFKYILSIVLVITIVSPAVGQHHYKGVGGFEMNYGSRLSGEDYDPAGSIFFSKYVNYRSGYKFGFNYFRTSVGIAKQYDEKMHNYHFEGRYSYTVVDIPNMLGATDFFFSLQGGGFAGLERLSGLGKYRDPGNIPYIEFSKYHRNTFVAGFSLTAEFEIFLSKRVALLIDVSEYWSPFSNVEKWNTTATAGLKFLIY